MRAMPDTDPPLWTAARRILARNAVWKWAGTPHANRIAVIGQGVDCVKFVFEVLAASAVCERFPIAAYDGRMGALRNRNVIADIITEYFYAHGVGEGVEDPTSPAFGDVAVFQCGNQSNHVGIYLDGEVWHVPGKGAVGPEAWANVAKRLQGLVRFDAPGTKKDPGKITWEEIRNRKDVPA